MNITKASQVIEETLTKLLADEIDPKKARAVASLLHVNVQHAQLALDYAKLRGGPVKIPSLEENAPEATTFVTGLQTFTQEQLKAAAQDIAAAK